MEDDDLTGAVDVQIRDGVGWLVMDRPEMHNAMDEPMAGALRDAAIELDTDDEVRAVVLTGRGGAFNTGADLTTLEGDETDGRRLRDLASRLHAAVSHLARSGTPVVSAVNGVAAGGGFGLALAGDVVLVSDEARFEFAYTRLGLSGDGGSTYFLPQLVGRRRAREIALLDEPIGPHEAVEMGLATEVVADEELEDRADEIATDLASGPSRAYAAIKRLLEASTDNTLADHLEAETETISRLAGTDDYARGHEAFLADEEPEFRGR